MAIGNVMEKGQHIYIYNEKGTQLACKQKGSKPSDGLKGYTSTTVNVQEGQHIVTYDEKFRQLSSKQI